MEKVRIPVNFNNLVTVELTESGQRILREYYAGYGLTCPRDTTITEELWHLMEIFGPSISITMHDMPFKGNTLLFHAANLDFVVL